MKRIAVALLGLLLGGALSGCARVAQDRSVVLSAISATEQLSRSYTYTVTQSGHIVAVHGVVADDFRYRVDASRDGRALASEVVDDDARAVRLDGDGVATLIASAGHGAPAEAAKLSAHTWLIDPTGAASLEQLPPPTRPSGDPLTDSLAALEYVRATVVAAQTVQKYNPQSESYRPKLDPFPAPPAGVVRYDLVPPDLPQREQIGGGDIGIENPAPGVPFFRLMAIYVRHGVVGEVREQIAVEPRLEDSQSNLEARLGDFAPGVSTNAPAAQQVRALLAAVNRQLTRRGEATVQPRTMHLTFTTLGSAGAVTLPSGATTTDLSALGAHGLVLYETS